jgi:hypothetical protein
MPMISVSTVGKKVKRERCRTQSTGFWKRNCIFPSTKRKAVFAVLKNLPYLVTVSDVLRETVKQVIII